MEYGIQYKYVEPRVGDNINCSRDFVLVTDAKRVLLELRDYYYGVIQLDR